MKLVTKTKRFAIDIICHNFDKVNFNLLKLCKSLFQFYVIGKKLNFHVIKEVFLLTTVHFREDKKKRKVKGNNMDTKTVTRYMYTTTKKTFPQTQKLNFF